MVSFDSDLVIGVGPACCYYHYSENAISLSSRCSARANNKHGKKSEREISGGFGEFDEDRTHSVRCSSPGRMGGLNVRNSGQHTTMDTICSSRNVNYKLSGSSKLVSSSTMQSEGGERDLLTPGTTKHFRARSPSPFEKHHHLNIDGLRISHLHNNNSEGELGTGSGSTLSIPTKCSSQLAKVLEKQIEVKIKLKRKIFSK